jgi:hypothetical protein
MDSMTLAFPDPDKRICVLTDASHRFYAGLVTQIHEEQLDIPMEEQDQQPLAFLSGVQGRATTMDSTREGRFRHRRHSDQDGLLVADS